MSVQRELNAQAQRIVELEIENGQLKANIRIMSGLIRDVQRVSMGAEKVLERVGK